MSHERAGHSSPRLNVTDPGSGVILGIIQRVLDRDCIRSYASVTLFEPCLGAEWVTRVIIDPVSFIETNGFDDKRVSLPPANRISVKGLPQFGDVFRRGQ